MHGMEMMVLILGFDGGNLGFVIWVVDQIDFGRMVDVIGKLDLFDILRRSRVSLIGLFDGDEDEDDFNRGGVDFGWKI